MVTEPLPLRLGPNAGRITGSHVLTVAKCRLYRSPGADTRDVADLKSIGPSAAEAMDNKCAALHRVRSRSHQPYSGYATQGR